MKTNRQTNRTANSKTPKRRTVDRGGGEGSARKSRRNTAETASSHRTRPGKSPAHTREARVPGLHTGPIARPVERLARPTSTSQAKARAKARKAKAPKVVRPRLTERWAARLASIDLRPRTLARKVPFVVLVIGALGLGLGLTLWLSTDSAERSYQLSDHRERNRLLQQQKEALERDVRKAESAPALAEAAQKLGMIPTRDTAHLVQDPSGSWVVVGTPKPADGVPPPPLNSKIPDSKPQVGPEVPVLVEPGPDAPNGSGPEALLRTPDGSSTVGAQHLPTQPVPGLPGMPGGPFVGQVPGVPPTPGLPVPGLPPPGGPVRVPVPAEVPNPLGILNIPPARVPAPLTAQAPVPLVPLVPPILRLLPVLPLPGFAPQPGAVMAPGVPR